MAVFAAAGSYLVSTVSSFMLFALIARLLTQVTKVGVLHPFMQAIEKLTDPCLKFAENVLPKMHAVGLLLALIFIVELIKLIMLYVLNVGGVPSVVAVIGMAVSEVMSLLANVAFYAIIIDALLSWIPAIRGGMLQQMLGLVTTPLLAPIRQAMSRYNLGVDLSPLVALVGIHMVQLLILDPFAAMAFQFMA